MGYVGCNHIFITPVCSVEVDSNIAGYIGFSFKGFKSSYEHNIVKILRFLLEKEGNFVENHEIFTKWVLVTANSPQV